MSGDLDLSDLPDDPTELMFAILEETLDRIARKMAYSGNQTYIPVLLEFLRFQVKSASRSIRKLLLTCLPTCLVSRTTSRPKS